jgi:hypothetical protein
MRLRRTVHGVAVVGCGPDELVGHAGNHDLLADPGIFQAAHEGAVAGAGQGDDAC